MSGDLVREETGVVRCQRTSLAAPNLVPRRTLLALLCLSALLLAPLLECELGVGSGSSLALGALLTLVDSGLV